MGVTREQHTKALYPKQDAEQLGKWYARHLEAMTAEGLHSKSDIAAQLAWRDKKISLQRDAMNELSAAVLSLKYVQDSTDHEKQMAKIIELARKITGALP